MKGDESNCLSVRSTKGGENNVHKGVDDNYKGQTGKIEAVIRIRIR